MWVYFASGLPSSQTLLAYQPPLPTNVRGYDGTPVQTFARERRVELSYDEYPAAGGPRLPLGRGQDFLRACRHRLPGPDRRCRRLYDQERHRRRPGQGRFDHHPAGRRNICCRIRATISAARSREAILAFRLESTLTKQQILELYLNSIFLGRNAYGVQAASRAYFDKDVNELTLPEAAYLAVLPKAPSNYDPVRATQKALDRRNYVLREMSQQRLHHRSAVARGGREPLGTIRYGSNEKFRQQGGYFMEEVRRELIKRFGEEAEGRPEQPLCGRPVGAHLDEPGDAGRRREGAARGPRPLRRRPRLARPDYIDIDGDWAGQLDRARSAPAFPTGARPSSFEERAARRRSASLTARPALSRARPPRCPSVAGAALLSTTFSRA